jgi:hypothetical protein
MHVARQEEVQMNNSHKLARRVAKALAVSMMVSGELGALGSMAGCAGVEHVGWVLAGTGKPATMVVANQTLVGEMLLRPDRTGEVRVTGALPGAVTGAGMVTGAPGASAAAASAIASCAGSLRFSGTAQGRIDMRCSDGSMFDMAFYLINEVKGFASGTSQDKPAALVFGMDEVEAQAYLSRAMARPVEMPKSAP